MTHGIGSEKTFLGDEALLPSRLKDLWSEVLAGRLTEEEYAARFEEWIGVYAKIWADALLLPGENDLKQAQPLS